MKEFYEDFIKMQSELPSVLKSAQGQAGQGKFKYADLSEIVSTIRPILSKHGFAFMQTIEGMCIHRSEITNLEFYVELPKSVLKTTLIHKSGLTSASVVAIEYSGDDIKKFGAAITYYKRYALQSMLGIIAEDDPDSDKDMIIEKKKVTPKDIVDSAEDIYIDKFCKSHFTYLRQDISDFLKARANYNKKTIVENINEFNKNKDTFVEEINKWLDKRKGTQDE